MLYIVVTLVSFLANKQGRRKLPNRRSFQKLAGRERNIARLALEETECYVKLLTPKHQRALAYLRRHRKVARNGHTKLRFLPQSVTMIGKIHRIFDHHHLSLSPHNNTFKIRSPPLPRSRWSCRGQPTNLHEAWILIIVLFFFFSVVMLVTQNKRRVKYK